MNSGVWAFGASSYADLVRKSADYTLDGIADQITAPTLIMDGENDQFLKGEPQVLHKALNRGDATLVTLTIAEGAGEHTHAGALGRAGPTRSCSTGSTPR
jgi:pimeloyl-ACP methyl ester carboxylesterase